MQPMDATIQTPSAAEAMGTADDNRRWWALAVLCASLLIITLDNTILNVAIPALVKDLDASTSQLQWIIDGYTLVFAGLLLTLGSVGDRFGRKGALMVGLLIFGTGSLLSAFTGSASQLIFTRATMGIGAALIMPSTLSLLTNIFRDPRERARAIGAWAAVAGASGALGPVIGGALLAHFSWGSIFFVNIPVIIVALVGGWFLLPSSKDADAPRLDPLGALLSIAGLVAVLWAIIEAPSKGWANGTVLVSLALGIGFLFGFVQWELRCSHPMLDVRFFKNRRFTAANVAITLVFFAMFGQAFLGTQYLQTVLGFSALQSGVRMLPMAMVMVALAPVAPRLVERVGTKVVVGAGMLIVMVGLIIIATIPVDDGYVHLLIGFMFVAAGMAMTMAPATESIMGSLPPAKAGVGSAMNDTTRQMGGALGVAILGSVFATAYRPGIEHKVGGLGLTGDQLARARDSIGGAVQVVGELPNAAGQALLASAKSEFVHGMHLAIYVAVAVVAVAAVVVFAFLPARASDHVADAPAPDGVDPQIVERMETELATAATLSGTSSSTTDAVTPSLTGTLADSVGDSAGGQHDPVEVGG
ncbi:MAG: drug resistance transporter [Ilumatobacteraceae bacterium]|nr:drug resistance transporter [Ilumatobacteraceae bacterium]